MTIVLCDSGVCDGILYVGCDMWCATGCMLLVVSAYVFGYLLVVCVALYCTMYTIVCVRCVCVGWWRLPMCTFVTTMWAAIVLVVVD